MNHRLILALVSALCILTYPSIGMAIQDSSGVGTAAGTSATQFSEKTERGVSGFSPSTQIAFSSLLESNGGIAVKLGIQTKSIELGLNSSGSLIRFGIAENFQYGGTITEKDQQTLSALYRELEPQFSNVNVLEQTLLSTIDMLLVMIQPGQRIELIERTVSERDAIDTPQSEPSFCEMRGQCGTAIYYLDTPGIPVDDEKVMVGDPATGCYGRCGEGCDGLDDVKKRVYTQECLNHDACTEANNGYWLGDCSDEWMMAATSVSLRKLAHISCHTRESGYPGKSMDSRLRPAGMT